MITAGMTKLYTKYQKYKLYIQLLLAEQKIREL